MKRMFPVLLGLGLATHAAWAQNGPPSPWRFSVETLWVSQSSADLDDGAGEFSLDRWFVSAGVDYAFDRRTSVGLSVGGGETRWDFGGLDGGAAPWRDVEDLRLTLSARLPLGEKGSVFLLPSLRSNHESGARSGDGETWGLLGGVAWRISDTLTLGPGLGAFEQLEDDTQVFPILLIDWDITERLNLGTGQGLGASQGPGLNLTYTLSPAWSLGLAGRYEQIDFRLRDDGPVPGGVGRDETFPLVATAAWRPNDVVTLALFGGAEFGGSLERISAAGLTLEEVDYDTTPVFGASLGLRF